MVRKIKWFLFTLAAVLAVSFSPARSALAATSYSTDSTYASNSYFTLNGLSLANSVGYELSDYESIVTSVNGSLVNSQNISYATAHISFPLTLTYLGTDNYGTFYFRLPLTFTRSFTQGITVIDKTVSISSPYDSISVVLMPSTGGSTYYLSVYGNDVDFTTTKAYRFNVDIDYYLSWRDNTTPSNVGSVTLSSTGFSTSTVYTGDLSEFAYQIGLGIDSSASMENLLGTLSAISSDTALLSSVLSNVSSINSTFTNFYSMLGNFVATGSQNPNYQNFFNAMRIYMQRIQAMLSGWSTNNATTPLDLANLTFDRWVDIISTAMENQAPDMTQAEADRDNVQSLSDTQHSAEVAIFTQADNALDDIDFNLSVPSGLIGAAVSIMSLTTLIWNSLGDFQFIAIATLTAGMIIVLLGVINRFHK